MKIAQRKRLGSGAAAIALTFACSWLLASVAKGDELCPDDPQPLLAVEAPDEPPPPQPTDPSPPAPASEPLPEPATLAPPPVTATSEPSLPPVGSLKPKVLFKTLWLDAKYVLPRPFHWNGHDWLLFGVAVASTGAAMPWDQDVYEKLRRDDSALGEVGTQLEGLGDVRSIALLLGFYGFGAIFKDSKAKDVCVDGLMASSLAAGIITPIISTAVGRDRPSHDNGAYSFKPLENRSFPGGHVTQAFAVASVIAASYDQWYVKVGAYAAGLVSIYERVRRGKHFLSDNIAGAAIGIAVGHTVVKYNRKLRSGEIHAEDMRDDPAPRLTLVPMVTEGGGGIQGTFTF